MTITGVDNDDNTGDVIVTVSATAENPSSLGVIAPEPVELAIADDETTPVVKLSLSPAEVFESRRFHKEPKPRNRLAGQQVECGNHGYGIGVAR